LRNLTDGGEGVAGKQVSEETRQKLRLASLGNTRGLGSKRSEETRQKMSSSALGHQVSGETRRRIGIANLGHKHSDEVRLKISIGHLGNKNALGKNREPKSDETRKKNSESAIAMWAKRKLVGDLCHY
jgi:hypothetical protein